MGAGWDLTEQRIMGQYYRKIEQINKEKRKK